jgi:undecaprenyl-diphosphatase
MTLSSMHELFNYFALGVIQGVTEFLPISSDGHLVILGRWLPTPGHGLTEVVLLHLGSLGALLWAFRRDLLSTLRPAGPGEAMGGPRLLALLALATLPVVLVGPLFHSLFQAVFDSVRVAALMLIVTGLVNLATRACRDGTAAPGVRSSLVMGAIQVFALLPGLSRSSLTMSSGFALGVDRRQAARFSFLMAVPAIAGANVYEMSQLGGPHLVDPAGIAVGILAAFFSGLLAIRALMGLVRRGRFEWFGVYCVAAGLAALALG